MIMNYSETMTVIVYFIQRRNWFHRNHETTISMDSADNLCILSPQPHMAPARSGVAGFFASQCWIGGLPMGQSGPWKLSMNPLGSPEGAVGHYVIVDMTQRIIIKRGILDSWGNRLGLTQLTAASYIITAWLPSSSIQRLRMRAR